VCCAEENRYRTSFRNSKIQSSGLLQTIIIIIIIIIIIMQLFLLFAVGTALVQIVKQARENK
jgi:hypothetical protein